MSSDKRNEATGRNLLASCAGVHRKWNSSRHRASTGGLEGEKETDREGEGEGEGDGEAEGEAEGGREGGRERSKGGKAEAERNICRRGRRKERKERKERSALLERSSDL